MNIGCRKTVDGRRKSEVQTVDGRRKSDSAKVAVLMDRRTSGGRAIAAVAVLAAAWWSTGCPWGATGTGGASGDEGLDDSAGAMVGTYRIASVSTASEDCEDLETTEPDEPGTVRISRTRNEGASSETQLRMVICRGGESCGDDVSDAGVDERAAAEEEPARGRRRVGLGSDPTVRVAGMTKASDDQGWVGGSAGASMVESAASARRCRFDWTSVELVPEESGVRIERTRRRKVVTLEGDMTCRAETAEAFAEQLTCVERQIWRAVADPTRDRG